MSLHVGVIAPDLPPTLGGMQEMGRQLITSLSRDVQVTAFTIPGSGFSGSAASIHDCLSGDPSEDAARLSACGADVWLGLNAGVAPLGARLGAPFACYFIGNDFLAPWVRYLGPVERLAHQVIRLDSFRRTLRQRSIRRALSGVHRALTLSERLIPVIESHFPGIARPIGVVPPGVADHFFQSREPEARGADAPLRILTVSRLMRATRRKNVDGTLRALAALEGAVPVHYTVVGDGDDRPYLEGLATELGIADRVTFAGAVSDEELLAHYRRADLFVLASRATAEDIEGFGIVYLEASASGVPVICSEEGGATEGVAEGRNGLTVPRSDPSAIAEGIQRFWARRDDFQVERVRGYAEEFRWERISQTLLGHLEECLSARAA